MILSVPSLLLCKFCRLSRVGLTGLLAVTVATVSSSAQAGESTDYNRDILPILAEHCFACHGADNESREADLRLDEREAAIEAGAIAAGHPDDSELIARVMTDDPDLLMPPADVRKPLSERQKEQLAAWIREGAEYQSHWSFIVPERPSPPKVSRQDWARNEIDSFVLAQLEDAGLSPAPEVDANTLFRRLHLDITGLPPAPQDVSSFADDYAARGDDALSEWIDRLMESPAWGEHRARYWLDAARYGDTHGLHFDNYREMWPYRDWVIRAFNSNRPFDNFTVEQLAGDLLPNPTDDQLIATGFQRCNITTNEGGTIDEENLAVYATDRVQTFGWVYLGLTTNCGQCHDHKFDPFTMKDYYSLAAYFRNTTQQAKDGNVKDGRGPVLVVPSDEDKPRWTALSSEIAAAQAARDVRRREVRPEFEQWLAGLSPERLEQRVPSADLQVSLPLTEGEGNTVRNACEPHQEFQAVGSVAWKPGGKLGSAPVISADSTLDLGQTGDFESDDAFSFGAWIRTSRARADGAIIARMNEQEDQRGWDLSQNNNAYAVHIVSNWPENAIRVTTPQDIIKPGEWHHVFVTYDGSARADGIRVYIDGERTNLNIETNTLQPEATIRTDTPLRIGQRSQNQVFKGGSLQDVRVYASALDAADVQTLAGVVPLKTLIAVPQDQRSPEQQATILNYYLSTVDAKYGELDEAVATLEAGKEIIRSRSPVTHIQRERMGSEAMAHILTRGAYDKPGKQVTASTPAALHPLPEDASPDRLGLARWVIDPANPLTARVTVNRFWQQLFGQGLVVTPEDFGVMGARPSHPELLDWLAVEFRENGWDVKQLFRTILMSATYRQSALTSAEKLERDRSNTLLSRGPRFRMDAEMVRDYALSVSGLLTPTMYGPGVRPYQPDGIWDIVGLPGGDTRDYVQDKGENLYRRSLYTFWKRMAPPPSLEAFNAPSREVCTVRRERTNTPLQALVTLNDPQFVEAARFLAQQALAAGGDDDSQVLDFVARRVLCRAASAEEQSLIAAVQQDLTEYYQSHPDDAQAVISVGETAADDSIDAARLATWTMVCNQVMNLDEVLCK